MKCLKMHLMHTHMAEGHVQIHLITLALLYNPCVNPRNISRFPSHTHVTHDMTMFRDVSNMTCHLEMPHTPHIVWSGDA